MRSLGRRGDEVKQARRKKEKVRKTRISNAENEGEKTGALYVLHVLLEKP